MTTPLTFAVPGNSAATAVRVSVPPDTSERLKVQYTDSLGEAAYIVTPETGLPSAYVAEAELFEAKVSAGGAPKVWSDPNLAVAAFHLSSVRDTAARLLLEVFGAAASMHLEIADPPALVFVLTIPREARAKRAEFVQRYVREATLPSTGPLPVLSWMYSSAVPA